MHEKLGIFLIVAHGCGYGSRLPGSGYFKGVNQGQGGVFFGEESAGLAACRGDSSRGTLVRLLRDRVLGFGAGHARLVQG